MFNATFSNIYYYPFDTFKLVSYIVVVSFMLEETGVSGEKSSSCRKSLTNIIT
jgi:hypothetical protein